MIYNRNNTRSTYPGVSRGKGFSLIEVLITVVILAIGLLGVAAVQVVSLQQTNNSYLQTKANIHAQDIAERLRANGGNALPAAESDSIEDAVKSSLGPDAIVQITRAGSKATITISWSERAPGAQESGGSQTRTLAMEARVAPI